MKIAVIGAGRWGANLIMKFSRIPGVELLVCDEDRDRASRFPLPWTRDHLEAIERSDAVVVATLPADHYFLAKAALDSGRHVLVEKPMTLSSFQARTLMEQAKRSGLVLMTDSTWEYHPKVMEVCQPVLAPATFKAFWLNPLIKRTAEDVLWTNGPHPVALMLRFFSGASPSMVEYNLEVRQDEAAMKFLFPTGEAAIFLSWRTGQRERLILAGGVAMDGEGLGIKGHILRHYADSDPGFVTGPDALESMCRTFISRVEEVWHHGEQHAWQDEIGARTVEIIERAHEVFQSK